MGGEAYLTEGNNFILRKCSNIVETAGWVKGQYS